MEVDQDQVMDQDQVTDQDQAIGLILSIVAHNTLTVEVLVRSVEDSVIAHLS
jgi:hypothetical protein